MQTIGISPTTAERAGRRTVLQKKPDHKHVRARRRVRLHYPTEVVECAVLLSCLLGVRRAASALDIRQSTLYRWFNKHRTRRSQFVVQLVEGRVASTTDTPGSMIVRCEDKSFTSHPYVLSQLRAKRDTSSVDDSITPSSHGFASERMLSIKALIDREYQSDWSCESLAERVGISRFQFINEFSAAFGKSPYHYLLGVRVHHAIELVKQRSDRTLAEIARNVGFGSSSSMHRAFKNFLGTSPANYADGSMSPMNLRPGKESVTIAARHAAKTKNATEHHAAGP